MKLLIPLIAVCCLAACSETPEQAEKSRARETISECWKEQGRKSNSAGQAQFVAGACELLEQRFKDKYKHNP